MPQETVSSIINEFHDNVVELWERGEQHDINYSDKVDSFENQAIASLHKLMLEVVGEESSIEEIIDKVMKSNGYDNKNHLEKCMCISCHTYSWIKYIIERLSVLGLLSKAEIRAKIEEVFK
jgi:hypothetical protein